MKMDHFVVRVNFFSLHFFFYFSKNKKLGKKKGAKKKNVS